MKTDCKGRRPIRRLALALRRAVLVAAVSPASAVFADPPVLGLPADCVPGENCYFQQYVDRDPGPGVSDYRCGTMANDGHRGVDLALPLLADMRRGVPVTASAAGTVQATRDGMPDIAADDPDAPDLTGRECGNGVVLDHGDGWETQYCHLREGSVAVRRGDRVAEGDMLGLIGMSGEATFPHVHLAVRRGGVVVDPFRPDSTAACGGDGGRALWASPPPYRPGGLLAVGLSDAVPDYDAVKDGLPEDGLSDPSAPVVLWAYLFSGREGDVVALEIDGPDTSVGREEMVLDKAQPFLFRAWGRRAPQGGWAEGDYTATVILRRGGTVLETRRAVATLP